MESQELFAPHGRRIDGEDRTRSGGCGCGLEGMETQMETEMDIGHGEAKERERDYWGMRFVSANGKEGYLSVVAV
ncbi:uncharacterized protein EAF01_004875 [Botrytis porri]|uniref:uncharacterized protein n=1 Tax=Botrytis porri TaxID=87229 RepID=UPI0019019927|nr:uncharacterized protein EAF01_004875 [Botrytis porri]KAF7907288.1 hypothetical protein EAF01_004875 [Botrytis porri]